MSVILFNFFKQLCIPKVCLKWIVEPEITGRETISTTEFKVEFVPCPEPAESYDKKIKPCWLHKRIHSRSY